MIQMNKKSELLDELWVEKYRPRSIDDVVLPDKQRIFLQKCVMKDSVPHLLFIGPQGSGKTTLALILLDLLVKSEMDVLFLNGSDQTGVDYVRNDIAGFLKSPPYKSKLKYVYIDEFDYMSSNAQAALRNIFERYASNGRFICTGNYQSKIIDPLISRFQVFEMDTIKEDFAVDYCEKILKAEDIEYDVNSVKLVVQSLLPDVRKVVGTLQQNVQDGKLVNIDSEALINEEKQICALIVNICDNMKDPKTRNATVNSAVPQILESLTNGEPDYRRMYTTLMSQPKFPFWGKIKVNQYANQHQSCAIPSAHFMAMIYDIISAGMSYQKMFSK